MDAPNRTYVGPLVLARELVRCGVRHACVSPGSRSAPLAIALAGEPALRVWSHLDERAGGFFALGLAKASRTPVVLVCTSGTAAANFLPAVVEAYHAQVPLVVLTADRPPELREVGAGQTVDQIRLFGAHVRWFVEVGTPDATPASVRWLRTLAARAVATAAGPPAGPVHLNLPLRDPLVPDVVPGDVPAALPEREGAWVRIATPPLAPPPADVLDDVAGMLAAARRALVVAGPLDDGDAALADAVAALCRAHGAPLVADAASNLRCAATADVLVDAHDAVLRHAAFAAAHAPDLVLRLGLPPTSKVTTTWLAECAGVPHVVLDASGAWTDPAGVATHVLRGDPVAACAALAARPRRVPSDPAWAADWRRAGATARAALDAAVDADRAPFEAHAVRALADLLPADACLWVGNSLSIRALDWFWPATAPPLRVLASRGANGIDGIVSSVLGAAAADPSRLTVGVLGDVSFLHDVGGLVAVRRHGVRAVLVVLDNDGGGIFDFLPVARQPAAVYEPLFATPHGLDPAALAAAFGVRAVRVTTVPALRDALRDACAATSTTVVVLGFPRPHSRAAHERAFAHAVAALGTAP